MSSAVPLPPVQTAGESSAGQDGARRKLEAEVKKLEAEAAKFDAEARAARRHPLGIPTTWASLMVGMVGILAGVSQLVVSDIKGQGQKLELERATWLKEKEKARLEQQLAEYSSALEARQAQVAQARAELEGLEKRLIVVANSSREEQVRGALQQVANDTAAVSLSLARSRPLVYLHFKGNIKRSIVEELQGQINALGFMTPSRIERVDGEYSTEVRYFDQAYAGQAEEVARTVTHYLSRVCGLPKDRPVATRRVDMPRIANPPIEIWISMNCSQTQ